jgi:hypothetical protein
MRWSHLLPLKGRNCVGIPQPCRARQAAVLSVADLRWKRRGLIVHKPCWQPPMLEHWWHHSLSYGGFAAVPDCCANNHVDQCCNLPGVS